MEMARQPQPVSEQRALAIDLTAAALAQVAPDEIPVLEETAAEFYADPGSILRRDKVDSPLGAGIEIVMLTPYLLAAAGAVLPVLAGFVGEIVKGVAVDVTKENLSTWIRRMIKGGPDGDPGVLALTAEQAVRVRATVVEQCFQAGLPSGQAALIADATVGALHIRP
jgi:hypothetical protein